MTYTPVPSARDDTYAMRFRSGDHEGKVSSRGLVVSVVSPVPSGLIRRMSQPLGWRMKTIGWVGSGDRPDRPGPVPSLQPIEIAAATPNVARARLGRCAASVVRG